MKFTGQRKLDTGDVLSDYLIPADEEFMIGWAYNGSTSDLSKKHEVSNSVYEWNLVTLKSDGSPVWNVQFPVPYEPFIEVIASSAVSF